MATKPKSKKFKFTNGNDLKKITPGRHRRLVNPASTAGFRSDLSALKAGKSQGGFHNQKRCKIDFLPVLDFTFYPTTYVTQ